MNQKYFMVTLLVLSSIILCLALVFAFKNNFLNTNEEIAPTEQINLDTITQSSLKEYLQKADRKPIDAQKLSDFLLVNNSYQNVVHITNALKYIDPHDSIWISTKRKAQKIEILNFIEKNIPQNTPLNNYEVVVYYKNDSTINGGVAYLTERSFNVTKVKSNNTGKNINAIWFNPKLDINIVKIVALTMILYGIEIQDIRSVSDIPLNHIRIGNEPTWENKYKKNKINFEYVINTHDFNDEFNIERIVADK